MLPEYAPHPDASDNSSADDLRCRPESPNSPIGGPSPASHRLSGHRRKLDAAAKDRICRLLAGGYSLSATARIVGVSRRTIYRERCRDPFFRQRLNEKPDDIAEMCFESLRNAAPKKFRAALHLYKLVYPDRFHHKPGTITSKQYESWIPEVLKLFKSIATPEQLRQLNRQLKKLPPDG